MGTQLNAWHHMHEVFTLVCWDSGTVHMGPRPAGGSSLQWLWFLHETCTEGQQPCNRRVPQLCPSGPSWLAAHDVSACVMVYNVTRSDLRKKAPRGIIYGLCSPESRSIRAVRSGGLEGLCVCVCSFILWTSGLCMWVCVCTCGCRCVMCMF